MKNRIFALFAAVILIVSSMNVSAKKTVADYFAEMEFPNPIEAIEQTPSFAIYKSETGEPVLKKKSDKKMTIKRISEITGIPSSSVDRYLKE